MNFLQRRRLRQAARHALHEVRHALAMREDLAGPDLVRAARAAEAGLGAARHGRDDARLEQAADAAAEAAHRLLPPKSFPRWRDNVEMLVVAFSVAMAFRTYFIQPFKIPTGSMQPTLYGITATPQDAPRWYDRMPFKLVRLALFGEYYSAVRARAAGIVQGPFRGSDDFYFTVAGVPHHVQLSVYAGSALFDPEHSMRMRVNSGDWVNKGDLIASGRVRLGDQIFVNKVRYNFLPPRRGHVIVFDTNRIQDSRIRHDSFYIKRLVGLPGETIALDPKYLVVNGQKITEPFPFHRLLNDPHYHGYTFAVDPQAFLRNRSDRIILGADEFLPFGDNTLSSLDGRYFGPVKTASLVGPAFLVYWPFSSRWGAIH